MYKTILRISFLLAALLLLSGVAQATIATEDEARQVARSWVASVVAENGKWGESPQASITDIGPVIRTGQLLGHFVNVDPSGFVIVGLLKELAPIKAFVEKGKYQPNQAGGFLAFIEEDMAEVLEMIELEFGALESIPSTRLAALTRGDHATTWERLLRGEVVTRDTHPAETRDYVPGTHMLTTEWNQSPPYNNFAPDLGCDYSALGFPPEFSNAWAGCTPVAGAQIMNYWAWPPLEDGIAWFDWDAMCNEYLWQDWNARFVDENGVPCSEASLYAVASICYSIGDMAGADFGCDGTSTVLCDVPGRDMLNAYEDHFYYDDDANCDFEGIGDDFSVLVTELNAGRPVHYGSAGHAFVVDGWNFWGSELVHIVYGWGGTDSGWWTLEDLLDREKSRIDRYIRQIQPIGCQGSSLPGGWQYPGVGIAAYRYLNRDATGQNTSYAPGIRLQFLQGVKITGTGTGGDYLEIHGGPDGNINSYLFARTKGHGGAKIMNGSIRLQNGGSIRIY